MWFRNLFLSGDPGDALVRENHNGYLASLEGKKATKDARESLEQQYHDQTHQMGQRMHALELQQASMCTMISKFMTGLQSILPEEFAEVSSNVIASNSYTHYYYFQSVNYQTLAEPLEAIMEKMQEYQDGPLAERRARLSRLFNVEPGHKTPVPQITFPIQSR